MRRFHSYGPVDERKHFCVPRRELIGKCAEFLVEDPEEGGHFFTIWSPRQGGKTWLMRKAVEEIRARHGDRFLVGELSMQGVELKPEDPAEAFLSAVPRLIWKAFRKKIRKPKDWDGWTGLFLDGEGLFDRPLILLIDEFDKLPRQVIDRLVGLFRDMYLDRSSYVLHGLALVGVRAVLGVDSERGSPFNVQRSLHVDNFTRAEVEELFAQYPAESGQPILPEVVEAVWEAVRGQPGLTCWFGELLTERFNPDPSRPIDLAHWQHVHARALFTERNNNILNLMAKAKAPYAREAQTLFVRPDVPFVAGQPWCDHLYLNGVITPQAVRDELGQETFVCRFASPFVQHRLYNAFSQQLQELLADVPVLDGSDAMEDVFLPERFDVAALLQRYKLYLERLRVRGRDPFQDQPIRADFQLREAVGHFHLYAWLLQAVGRVCSITPEFPTGNGKVDLRLRYQGQSVLVEVKSLGAAWELPAARAQAARYARQQGLEEATLALFVPTERPDLVARFEGTTEVEGIAIHVVAVSWRP